MSAERVQAWLFRHRGWVPVAPILVALVFARPTREGLFLGLAVMLAGEAIRLWGAAHLGPRTRSSVPVATGLVTSGPFAHTRHPLYWGNLLLSVGFALASGAGRPWFPLAVGLLFVFLYGAHAIREEAALAASFPRDHAAYAAVVPRWWWRPLPARIPGVGERDKPSWRQALDVELLTLHAEAWLAAALVLRGRGLP